MRETITTYILTNPIINDYLSKIDKENRNDFAQHIYLIIWEMMDDKIKYKRIKGLFQQGQLGKFIIGIINNQLKSNTSSFTKIYKDKRITYINEFPILNDETHHPINPKIVIVKIIDILNNVYYYDSILYKLYRGIDPITNEIREPMTYQQIQKLIGINYQAVRSSVIKTDKMIKEKIKL